MTPQRYKTSTGETRYALFGHMIRREELRDWDWRGFPRGTAGYFPKHGWVVYSSLTRRPGMDVFQGRTLRECIDWIVANVGSAHAEP